MNEKKREGAFIPCGDSMEKMQEIEEAALEAVSGGSGVGSCARCGGRMGFFYNEKTNMLDKLACIKCGWTKP